MLRRKGYCWVGVVWRLVWFEFPLPAHAALDPTETQSRACNLAPHCHRSVWADAAHPGTAGLWVTSCGARAGLPAWCLTHPTAERRISAERAQTQHPSSHLLQVNTESVLNDLSVLNGILV